MSFAHPAVLALIVIPAGLIRWTWRRSGRRVVLPFDHGRQGSGRGWKVLLSMAESLPALILATVIVILAGPQRLSEPRSRRVLTNIEFCVDISGSMTAPFGDGSRYDASMKAIDEFLNYRKGDAFGLTFFGNNVLQWVPLTGDPSAVRCAPPFMRPENAPPWMGGTMIAKALQACKATLSEREEGDRMIILVTDGFSSDLDNGNDEAVARELKAKGIAVYAIHVAETEVPPQIVTITSMTGGEVFSSTDPDNLKGVFQRIDAMKRTRIEKTIAETLDNYAPFCVAGLSMMGLCGCTLLGLRYTPW